MQPEELSSLVREIQKQRTEKQGLECKSAHAGCPSRLYDTLSSFSNQDDGGIIVFGIDESKGYEIVGVYDAQDLQKKVTEQCKQMEPVVRALFTVCEIDEKIIVSAEIPGAELSERPVFYKGVGRIKGSYIRVDESDEPMTEYEIYSYDAFRKRIRDELTPVDRATMNLFHSERISKYLEAVKKERKNLAESVSDDDILQLMAVHFNGTPTLAGVMAFSRYPQAYFPQLCITAIAVPGTEIGETGSEGERFIDNERITGSISEMLDAAVDFVRRNSRTKTIITENGQRIDKPEYPMIAVREALLNALIHRDYSVYTQNMPIRLEMYRDRMVIQNPGGLYGRTSIESLGKIQPETRNPVLANILELLHVTENRYSGIPTIRKAMKDHGLSAPVFNTKYGEFSVTFKNNIYTDDVAERSCGGDILSFCETPRTRAELIAFTGFSRQYTMTMIIQPLIDSGKIKLTLPDKPKSSKQKYVKA